MLCILHKSWLNLCDKTLACHHKGMSEKFNECLKKKMQFLRKQGLVLYYHAQRHVSKHCSFMKSLCQSIVSR